MKQTQKEYSTLIQEKDVPWNAKAFMIFCELKEVYNEKAFFVLLYEIYLSHEKAKNYNAKYQVAKKHEQVLLNKYVYDQVFEFSTAWTYKDVLAWFRKFGFPRKSPTLESEYENLENIYQARFFLRGMQVEEAILVALLAMRSREAEIEDIKANNERMKMFEYAFSVFTIIASIAAAPFSGGQSLWITVLNIIAIVASAITLAITIADDIMSNIKEQKIKDTHQKNIELMLKNLPKKGSFVDQSITDPYAMYANGRLWKQGGAGEDNFDPMLGYQPYRALIEDKFNQSDVYEIIRNNRENMAGMPQYLSHLYPEGKWSNPQSIKDMLYGNMKYYLPMRFKIAQAITRWLTKKGYLTFYVSDKKPVKKGFFFDEKNKWFNFWHFVHIEDNAEAYGFTDIRIAYPSNNNSKVPIYHYAINVTTSWDKEESENKTSRKWNSITSSSYIANQGIQTKILKGNQIQLRKSPTWNFGWWENVWTYTYQEETQAGKGQTITIIKYLYVNTPFINGLGFAFDKDLYYECEFESFLYGEKELHKYKSIKKILNYEAVEEYKKELESNKLLDSNILNSLSNNKNYQVINNEIDSERLEYIYDEPVTFTNPIIYTATSLIHRIRGEHKFQVRFKNPHQEIVKRDTRDFYYAEFCNDPFPEIHPKNFRGSLEGLNNTQLKRVMDKGYKKLTPWSMKPINKAFANPKDKVSIFADRVYWFSNIAGHAYNQSQSKKITMYYQEGNEYFNISPFIEPKANISVV